VRQTQQNMSLILIIFIKQAPDPWVRLSLSRSVRFVN